VAAVKERFGFGPELVVDYKALRGDTSDNISGVPGIGEKTATELIQKFTTIEKLYQAIKKNTPEIKEIKAVVLKKLEDGEDKAEMSKYLAAIDCNVPDLNFDLEKCRVQSFDREKIIALFQRFEFASLLKRIPELNSFSSETTTTTSSKKVIAKNKNGKTNEFTEVTSSDQIEDIKRLAQENKQFSAEALQTSADIFSNPPQGLVVLVGEKTYYIADKFFEDSKEIFSYEEVELVGHDLKQLIKILTLKGVEVKNKLFDSMIASYLLAPGSRAHDSSSIILKVLGKELPVNTNQTSLFGVDPRLKAEELYLLNKSASELKTELIRTSDYSLMKDIEMPLVPVLADMELAGVSVDNKMLQTLSKNITEQIKRVSKEIYELSGEEFNISSPLQLREVLFEKMNIPVMGIKKGKTGLSTSQESLEKLRGVHPIIEKIEEYREICKLQNTYIDVLPTLINPKTHRIHAKFNQAVAATGRLSGSDPNLQNIPIRTELGREIRKAFIADKGNVLLSADYSQLELRIVASLAKDKKMIEIFEAGLDIHAATAAAINDIPLDKVTKQMRYAAKEVNFGVLYGMGVYGLAWRAGISREQAKAFIQKYFEEFSGVKKYIDETIEFAKKNGYSETLFGRRRYVPELTSTNHQLRAAGERMATNHPIQGTEADMIKKAMIELYTKFNLHSSKDIKMIMQVHDELVFEVKKELAEEVQNPIKEIMESVVKLNVPVKVEVNFGKNWGDIH
jgi:DNA polymerase-1